MEAVVSTAETWGTKVGTKFSSIFLISLGVHMVQTILRRFASSYMQIAESGVSTFLTDCTAKTNCHQNLSFSYLHSKRRPKEHEQHSDPNGYWPIPDLMLSASLLNVVLWRMLNKCCSSLTIS